jgi:hypothetical protein
VGPPAPWLQYGWVDSYRLNVHMCLQLEIQLEKVKMNEEMRAEYQALSSAEHLTRIQRELEAKALDGKKGAGLRQMRQIMIRIAKGATAERLEMWRSPYPAIPSPPFPH